MITCPWCGTGYQSFQPNCDNCGGSLPLPVEEQKEPSPSTEPLPSPPLPPRNVPRQVVWRMLITDGWAISGFIFSLLGFIFGLVGGALTISVIAAFVGIPFVGTGLLFLSAGIPILVWRTQKAQRTVDVLRNGVAALGEIESVSQNYQVRVNGRYPWTVAYRYEAAGRPYRGRVTTLSRPDLSKQPGKPVYVLYQEDDPEQNTIYPSPYGYYGV